MSDQAPPRLMPQAGWLRRAIVGIPSAFTLANLFFGIWAIVYAAQGNFTWAGWFIVFAGMADILDGRLARMSHTGTRFGAELDSLVDVISFGVAPAMIMYFLEFAEAGKSPGRFASSTSRRWPSAWRGTTSPRRPVPGWFTGLTAAG
jgi:phosphatidylserine synthase